MTDINIFKDYIDFISNKVQVGNSTTPKQFNELAQRAQMQVFEKDRAIFIAEDVMSDFLRTFSTTKVFAATSLFGEINSPDDLEHIVELRSYHLKNDGKGVEVDMAEVKNADWGKIKSSSLFEATSRFPKYSEFGSKIRYIPNSLSNITLDYLRTPVKPIWAFDVVNGRPVYNSSNSVNFEWSTFSFNNVAAMYFSLLSVNLKDDKLAEFAQMYKQETNSVI